MPVTVIASPIEALPAAEPFDAVVCALVLCSVGDLDGVLRQIRSVLKQGHTALLRTHREFRVGADGCSNWPMPRFGRGCRAIVTLIATPTRDRPGRFHRRLGTTRDGPDTDAAAGMGARTVVRVRPSAEPREPVSHSTRNRAALGWWARLRRTAIRLDANVRPCPIRRPVWARPLSAAVVLARHRTSSGRR